MGNHMIWLDKLTSSRGGHYFCFFYWYAFSSSWIVPAFNLLSWFMFYSPIVFSSSVAFMLKFLWAGFMVFLITMYVVAGFIKLLFFPLFSYFSSFSVLLYVRAFMELMFPAPSFGPCLIVSVPSPHLTQSPIHSITDRPSSTLSSLPFPRSY